jgi:hypothetical protein
MMNSVRLLLSRLSAVYGIPLDRSAIRSHGERAPTACPGANVRAAIADFVHGGPSQLPPESATDSFIVIAESFYLELHPDLQQAFGSDVNAAYDHWGNHGIYEGRMGSAAFDARTYLASNPDVAQAFGPGNFPAAVQHFLEHGIHEGRASSPIFDVQNYLTRYPDLGAVFGRNYAALARHFEQFGINEGRSGSSAFDPVSYLSAYADLQNVFGPTNYRAATIHWLRHGRFEGRRGTP